MNILRTVIKQIIEKIESRVDETGHKKNINNFLKEKKCNNILSFNILL